MNHDPLALVQQAAQNLHDKKGFNILALDVQGICSISDFFLIAEGNVDRHVRALAQAVIQEFKAQGVMPLAVDGLDSGDWVVVDFGFVIVHLFIPEMRHKYRLENVWSEGKLVDLQMNENSDDTRQAG